MATHLKQAVLSHLCQLLEIFCNACDFLVFGNFAFARVAEQEKKLFQETKTKVFLVLFCLEFELVHDNVIPLELPSFLY